MQSIYDNTGFKAAINWNENDVLVYELAIPLAAFREQVAKNNLELEFELNAVDQPKENERRSQGSNAYSGGGGRMGGGHMGGSGGGRGYGGGGMRGGGTRSSESSGSRPMLKMYEKESFRTNYTMAVR